MRHLFVFMLALAPMAVVASPQDMPPMPPLPPSPQDTASRLVEQRFAQADTNHDGKLTLNEAEAGMSLIVPFFNQIDVGHKGYVTLDQIKAFAKNQMPAGK